MYYLREKAIKLRSATSKRKEKKDTGRAVGMSENPVVKPTKQADLNRITITINPDLNRFSGDEFVPEKYKEDEIRLTKSILLPFK